MIKTLADIPTPAERVERIEYVRRCLWEIAVAEDATLIVTGLFALLQVALLCTPPVLAYVHAEDDAVTSH
jgi:hypothetical protein